MPAAQLDVAPELLSPEVSTKPANTEQGSGSFEISRDWPWLALAGGVAFAFWPLFARLPGVWFDNDTYYAHGAVVPICSAFIVAERWPKIKSAVVKPAWWAAAPLLALLYLTYAAAGNSTRILLSVLLVATALCATLVLAGARQLWLLAAPILYLLFGLPVWDNLIDRFTQPLQQISTDSAFQIFRLLGQRPYRVNPTTILLNSYTLDVGVPCSGLKLLLAVTSIVAFFILVARLKWTANAVLAVAVLPLTLVVNGIRICMIGLVGDRFGAEAGHKFHDYSGYISLVICFFLLYKLTKTLGWK